MICSSVKRFFTSNLLRMGNWTPNRGVTQNWGDVEACPASCSTTRRSRCKGRARYTCRN